MIIMVGQQQTPSHMRRLVNNEPQQSSSAEDMMKECVEC